MKNKSVMTLGITILLSIGLTACSNSRETVNNDAVEALAEVTSTTESVTVEETEAESLTEETTESVDIEDGSIEETTEIEGSTVEESSIEETIEESAYVEESSIEETIEESTYTISELSQTMYATTNCRVRKGPSTDDEVVSTLNKGEAVQVTGKVNEVNWYEIVIGGEKEYVSGSLLSDTKPVEQSTQATQPSTPTQVENTQPSTPPSSSDAPINPITGEQMKPGDSYVDPTDGVRVHYIGNSLEYYNAQ